MRVYNATGETSLRNLYMRILGIPYIVRLRDVSEKNQLNYHSIIIIARSGSLKPF